MKAPRFILLLLLLLLTAGVVAAATTTGTKRRARPSRTNAEDASKRIDVNNISMVVKNTGSFAYDTQNGASGLEFPKGTGKTAVFAAGLWLGALVDDTVRVSVSEYSDDFKPGAIIGSGAGATPDNPANVEYKVYKLDRNYPAATGGIDRARRDAVLADYKAGAEIHGAPVVDTLADGSLNIVGDQMLWSVFNDLGKTGKHNGASSARPLGVEVQLTTFAFSGQGALGNTVFSRYRIINKGAKTLANAYVSQWSDPDLGGATDDLVGCDTTLSVGYVYNATNTDEQYGDRAPCVGYDFLQGPKVGGVPLGLASFNKYPNGGGPQDSTETYNYMQGLLGDGTPVTFNGQPTNFNVSGDPVQGTGFLDSAPSDRRLMLSSGPFTMAPGDTQEVVVGIVVAQGESRLGSIALMKCFDETVQAAYDSTFDLPRPPINPTATFTPRDGEVFIRWDNRSETIYDQPPYEWQGYNVYQGSSIAGPWTRLVTYDLSGDTITTVLDTECDPTSPVPLKKPKAFGSNSGLRYALDVTDDKIRGGPLHSGTAYYFAVTAYSVGLGQLQQVLESPINPVTVVPQTPAAGFDSSPAGSGPIGHILLPGAPPGTPLSTDFIDNVPLDPANMVDASWKLGFKPAGAGSVFWLTRTVGAQVDTVVNNWPNFTGDENYMTVSGVQTKFVSYPIGQLGRVSYETAGTPALEGFAGAGLRFFDGGADYAQLLFGSSIPAFADSTHNCELRFNGGDLSNGGGGQYAYRYLRTLDSEGNRIYYIQDYVPVPFQVWDTDANVQLNAAFLENDGAATEDGKWDPGNSGDGGRELVWVLHRPYFGDATPDSAYFTDEDLQDVLAGKLDARYVVWPLATSAGAAPANGDKLKFISSLPHTLFDEYSFETTAPNPFDASLAKGELSKVRAVPNPYFAHSQYELNRFNRVLKFTHLPARCTIRLFNLAGDLVRTIEKNDDTSQATWDLNTNHGLPIGSGVYIFHIDAPGVGTTTGKVAVFMEKERLNNF